MELKKNPFYILGVSCEADRAAINDAADELSFFDENGDVEQAQLSLLNPAKRLQAELDWFPGLDKAELEQTVQCIKAGRMLNLPESADRLSQLNGSIYNFGFTLRRSEALRKGIVRLDRDYATADAGYVTELINRARQKARIAEAKDNEVTRELNRKRAEIRQAVTEKLSPVEEDEYVQLVTQLAEELSEYSGGIVSDVIDQYEIRMHDRIRQSAETIERRIEEIRTNCPKEKISQAVDELILDVADWDMLAQPIQLRGLSSGLTHEISQELGMKLQRLMLDLNNERDETEAAAKLARAMKGVFAELPALAQNFQAAERKLSGMVQQQREAQELMEAIKDFQTLAETSARFDNSDALDAKMLGNEAAKLDQRIQKLEGIDQETKKNLRMHVCLIAREQAIRMHNSHMDKAVTAVAALLIGNLYFTFKDIPELRSKLREEFGTLMWQMGLVSGVADPEEWYPRMRDIFFGKENTSDSFGSNSYTSSGTYSSSGKNSASTAGSASYSSGSSGSGTSSSSSSTSGTASSGSSSARSTSTKTTGRGSTRRLIGAITTILLVIVAIVALGFFASKSDYAKSAVSTPVPTAAAEVDYDSAKPQESPEMTYEELVKSWRWLQDYEVWERAIENVPEELVVTEYGWKVPSAGIVDVALVIKNTSKESQLLCVDGVRYDKDGNELDNHLWGNYGGVPGYPILIGAGETSFIEYNDVIDPEIDPCSIDYEWQMEAVPKSSMLRYLLADSDDHSVTVTNKNNEDAVWDVYALVLFFEDDQYKYWTILDFMDDDFELKPGESISQEIPDYVPDYDHMEIYFQYSDSEYLSGFN